VVGINDTNQPFQRHRHECLRDGTNIAKNGLRRLHRFDADIKEELTGIDDYAALQQFMDAKLTHPEDFYAVRVDGLFEYVKTRSVPAQSKPYPALSEVIKQQVSFELKNVRGHGSVSGARPMWVA
jgi:alpha-acetolactate decarboxylase